MRKVGIAYGQGVARISFFRLLALYALWLYGSLMAMFAAATVAVVVREYGVWNAAVRDDLNRTTIVVELLLCDYV